MKDLVKKIVKLLKTHLEVEVGESWERGDIYIMYKDIETVGNGVSFSWDDDFWKEVETQLLKDLKL